MSSDNYIPISASVGAIAGGLYGFRNPSEKVCKKIAGVKPTITETMKEYADSFDIMQAGKKVKSGELSLDEYKKTARIYKAVYNTFEKEKQITDVMNTPIEERTMTFRQAVKEANKTRPELYKAMFGFNNKFKAKLTELEIFDAEKFSQAYKQAAKKMVFMYKELGKGALKGLGIGAVAGVLIGHSLNKIADNK